MMKRPVLIGFLLAATLSFACADTAPAPVVHDRAADMTAINALRTAYATAFKAGDAAAIGALFTADGKMMEPGMPTAEGPAAIEAAMKEAFGMMTATDITITPEKTEVVGDVAYETGMFKNSLTMKADGAVVTDEGRYVVVLRRQADGSWKLAADMGNSPTMPPAAAASK